MAKNGKIIVISAPSGTGKSTIINSILDAGDIDMQFSVSATNRAPRQGEQDGVNYHFLTTEQFRDAIAAGEFVEWEQVYPGRYYGTLKSELRNKSAEGHNLVLDVDVKGGMNVKKMFGPEALSIFIMPPSISILRERLEHRATDSPAVIAERLDRAAYEISFAPKYDITIVNDDLQDAIDRTRRVIIDFLEA